MEKLRDCDQKVAARPKLTRRAQLERERKICLIAKASVKVANIHGNEPTVGKTSNKQRVSCRTPRKEAAA